MNSNNNSQLTTQDSKRKLILIANDDGYHSPGIHKLVDIVQSLGDVIVCAPESGRSGFSCAFSAAEYLRLKPRKDIGKAKVWSCTGTPVDCVKMALSEICKVRKPDIILSGINHGDNSSVNSHYSGTMGACMEGCMKYIPSVAFSSCYYNEDANLEPLRPYIEKIVSMVLERGLPKGVCLNVNFPAREKFEGVKACRMTWGSWVNEVDKRHHQRGFDYYWMVGEYRNDEPEAPDTDQWALNHGYVAITPTTVDVTSYDFLKELKSKL